MNSFRKLYAILPLLLVILLLITENYIVLLKSELPLNYIAYLAFIKGAIKDVIFPVIVLFIFFIFNSTKLIYRHILALCLTSCLMLSICDLVHYDITLTRFNWSALYDLNWYSLKATISLLYVFYIFSIISLLCVFYWTTVKIIGHLSKMKVESRVTLRASLLLIIILLLLFEFNVPLQFLEVVRASKINVDSRVYQNLQLESVSKGSLLNFLQMPIDHKILEVKEYISYSADEKHQLQELGLLHKTKRMSNLKQHFNRVIILTLEGAATSYFSYHNKDIPKETSPFINQLLRVFPHHDNYVTSEAPTNKGIFSMIFSRIPYSPTFSWLAKHKSIFEIFKEKTGGSTYFIRATSKYYGGEYHLINKLYNVDHFIAQEDIEKNYPPLPVTEWGYHNPTVYDIALKVMDKHRDEPLMVFVKTMDMHQPPYYCGFTKAMVPKSIRDYAHPILPSVFWADWSLSYFFKRLKEKKLFTEKTLIVITSDHHPIPGWGHKELVQTNVPIYKERLPLIFVSLKSKLFADINKNEYASQIDFAPTICSLIGANPPSSYMGKSLLLKNKPAYSLTFHDEKFIYSSRDKAMSFSLSNTKLNAISKWCNNIFSYDY